MYSKSALCSKNYSMFYKWVSSLYVELCWELSKTTTSIVPRLLFKIIHLGITVQRQKNEQNISKKCTNVQISPLGNLNQENIS